jgi:hypothetical protein
MGMKLLSIATLWLFLNEEPVKLSSGCTEKPFHNIVTLIVPGWENKENQIRLDP